MMLQSSVHERGPGQSPVRAFCKVLIGKGLPYKPKHRFRERCVVNEVQSLRMKAHHGWWTCVEKLHVISLKSNPILQRKLWFVCLFVFLLLLNLSDVCSKKKKI